MEIARSELAAGQGKFFVVSRYPPVLGGGDREEPHCLVVSTRSHERLVTAARSFPPLSAQRKLDYSLRPVGPSYSFSVKLAVWWTDDERVEALKRSSPLLILADFW